MRERLREIAEQLAGARIDRFGEETEVVGDLHDLVEELFRAFIATGSSERTHEPEGAEQDRPFRPEAPVAPRTSTV
jgi:hypothetical protein